jgi:hypothetical protein
MIIKHSQGRIDSVYDNEEWKKMEKTKKIGKEERSPKKQEKKEK